MLISRRARTASLLAAAALSIATTTGVALASTSGRTASVVEAAKAEYTVDAVHSTVIFRIKHNEASYSYGRFNAISGTVTYDKTEGLLGMDVTVDVKSVDTANSARDEHLRGPDFFNTKQFPKATFKSTSVAKKGDHTYEVTGDFTLTGVTKSITVTVEHTGNGKSMQGGDLAGFETTLNLKRSDYGITKYLPSALGDDVRLTISLEAGAQ